MSQLSNHPPLPFGSGNLRALQQGLAAQITAPNLLPADGTELPADAGALPALLRPLRGQAPALEIYQYAWQARLTEALRSNFPVLHKVLGDDDFGDLAQRFARACPASQPSIRWFGARLPGYLAEHPDELPHPALLDLVRMEWALGASFDAADAPPLRFETLAATAPEAWPDLRFAAHPSVALLKLEWAIEPLWRALTLDGNASTEPPEAFSHTLLVWRQGLDSQWRSLEADEACLLQAALGGLGGQGEMAEDSPSPGASFAELCALAAEAHAGQADAEQAAALSVASALRGWVDAGLLLAS